MKIIGRSRQCLWTDYLLQGPLRYSIIISQESMSFSEGHGYVCEHRNLYKTARVDLLNSEVILYIWINRIFDQKEFYAQDSNCFCLKALCQEMN